ncbi:hypothetical protein KUTeg_012953 [Tegillarca granosa]|uniref:RNA polymerase II-associated protein 1 n=1 Tax=Tegillarca granosa TaxID=220873 RepID=A0ABQ9ES89_TEGGR|nr:hypothetical protein KUTeg_012953 [Tegillarca granosa]
MIPRPKPGESEDDLLKFQQEFLANQNTPSASIIKPVGKRKQDGGQLNKQKDDKDIVQMDTLPSTIPSVEHTPPVKKSRFRTQQNEKKSQMSMDPEEMLDEHDTHMAAVLTKIIERDTHNAAVHTPGHMKQAFPSVFHRGEVTQSSEKGEKKKSLFAQQFSQMKPKDFGVIVEQESVKLKDNVKVDNTLNEAQGNSSHPHVIEGTGLSATFGKEEAMKIHEENLQKISAMSTDEILEEQKKLLQMLDPKLVSFLKSKKSMSKPVDEQRSSDHMECEVKEKEMENISDIDDIEIPVKPNKDWVHMDNIEYDKLTWMKDLPKPMTGDNKRAGYTLEELFQLVRSTNLQQRILALNTLANVLKKAKLGELEELVQTPILPTVLNAGIIFLLRWALDDTNELVISAAVSALFSLLVNTADEITLDRVFSWYQGHVMPFYCPVDVQKEISAQRSRKLDDDETAEESDADVLKKDVIMVVQCSGLLELIFQEFLPTSWEPQDTTKPVYDVYGFPVPAAMKLIRSLDLFSSLTEKLRLLQQTNMDDLLTTPRVDNSVALLGVLEAVLHVANKNSQRTEFKNRFYMM